MPRILSDSARNVIERQRSGRLSLVYMDLPDNELFLAIDAPHDIEFQRLEGPIIDAAPQTWTAVGGEIVLGPVEESGDLDACGQDLEFAAVDPGFQLGSIFLASSPFNRDYQHWKVHFDESTGQAVASWFFHGKLNGRVEVDVISPELHPGAAPGTIRVRLRATNPLALLDVVRCIRTNPESHQKHYPGDLGMDQVAATMNRRIFWGYEAPQG